MPLHPTILAALLAACILAGTTACSTPAPAPPKPPLFVRLGGMPGLTAVVDDFVSKVSVDRRSKRSFEGVNLIRLKASVVAHVCALSGGPCEYKGDPMALAHQGMAISKEELSVMGHYVDQALRRQGVAPEDREALESMLDKLGPEVLNK